MPMRLNAAALCALSGLLAQAPSRDAALLERIREHMQQRLHEVPNYTCAETIERMARPANARKFEEIDKVRLEVAQVGRTELLAWPGGRFESRPLSAFVPSGLMSNGTFVMHARNLFLGESAHFRYAGTRKLIRFDYQVPRERSGYRIRGFGQTAVVGYHGSFWADPRSLDVVRVEVYADAIPQTLRMLKAETAIEYQRIRIGSAEALLPKTAELTVTRQMRLQERNRITFSGCRQYGSESMITYAAPAESADQKPREIPPEEAVRGVPVPAGLRVEMVLRTPLDAALAAIGTPVEAVIESDVVEGGRVIIPRGTLVGGRVRSVRKVGKPPRAIEIGLEFTEARWSGGQAQLDIGLEEFAADAGLQREYGWTDDSMDPPRIGMFYVKGPGFRLPAGLKMIWKSLALRR